MRIALALHSLDPSLGGVTSATVELASALAARGHQVSLISFDVPSASFLKDISLPLVILGTESSSKNCYGYIRKLSEKLSVHEQSFDILILNGLWLYSTAGLAAWAQKTKIPYLLFPHGMLDPYFARAYPFKHLKKLFYWLFVERRDVFRAAALCYATTSEKALAQLSFPFFHPRRQEVVGLGLRSYAGSLPSAKEAFLQAFPSLRDKSFLLYLSRFHPKKAPDLLLRALKKFPSMTLVMAGPEEDTAYFRELKKLSDGYSGHEVLWTGLLTGEKKWGALAAADALVLPSHQENFGMVVAEALSVGTPALVSDQVALAADILADHCGLVAPDRLEGVYELLQGFFALSNAQKETLRANALRSYEARFTPAAVAERLEKLMGEVL